MKENQFSSGSSSLICYPMQSGHPQIHMHTSNTRYSIVLCVCETIIIKEELVINLEGSRNIREELEKERSKNDVSTVLMHKVL